MFPELILYDIDALAFLVAKHSELIGTFESLTREGMAFSETQEPQPTAVDLSRDLASSLGPPEKPRVLTAPERKGADLCEALHKIEPGRADAKKFECKMLEALRYIFEKDLTAWSAQEASDTRLSIYDVIARVASEHDFWTTLVTQFSSRYIVFEFKNYTDQIKQGQIYTTEKYLYRTALRASAIIVSREGVDDNVLAAARGALRESGKLIINLNLQDICDMLHARDSNDDHDAILVDRVDEMLMKLER